MSQIDNKLNEILDIEPTIITEKVIVPMVRIDPNKSDLENDYNTTRKTLNTLIESGVGSLSDLGAVAKATENPYAYLVMATMIKNIAETTRELLDAQVKVKEILAEEISTNVNIDKAVFVGSTKDLLLQMKKLKDESTDTK